MNGVTGAAPPPSTTDQNAFLLHFANNSGTSFHAVTQQVLVEVHADVDVPLIPIDLADPSRPVHVTLDDMTAQSVRHSKSPLEIHPPSRCEAPKRRLSQRFGESVHGEALRVGLFPALQRDP
jgi:hypothetical protein